MLGLLLGFVVIIYFLFHLLWRLYVGIEMIWFGKNAFDFLKSKWRKKENIKQMKAFPKGSVYQAKNNSSKEAFAPIASLLSFWEDPYTEEFPCLVGRCLNEQIKNSKKTMRQHSVYRKLRFIDIKVKSNKNGKIYRYWHNGDKEWRYCSLQTSVLEQYCEIGTNKVIKENYYADMFMNYLMSRRLRPDDKKRARTIDQWGRIREIKHFYQDKGITCCPSCGGALPQDLKDILCPYCDSTIFTDFYDWQVELLEMNKASCRYVPIAYIIWHLFTWNPVETLVGGRGKSEKQKDKKIVRFSENDFLCEVYEDILHRMPQEDFIDLNLGGMNVVKIRNSQEESFVTIQFPLYKTYFSDDGTIVTEKEKQRVTYKRKRYPNRFKPKEGVIFEEKQCPACGGAFSPDAEGNCKYCGSFLLLDNKKWIRAEESR